MTTPEDLTVVNLPDLVTPVGDMATTPADMVGPARDMTGQPVDMTGPAPDLTGGPLDLSVPRDLAGLPPDLTGPTVDLSVPPRDMTGVPVDLSVPPVDLSIPPTDLSIPPVDMTGPRDLAVPPADLTGPRDLAVPPADMSRSDMGTTTTGGIGDPCTSDSVCKIGGAPKCWLSNVLNNPTNPTTPNGYCSSTCSTDTDCGSGNRCVNLGAGNYCLAGCANATTCRHPGYACQYYDTSGGLCFSDSKLDCDPKATGGACTETGTGVAGGCLRQAYENKGLCSAGCTLGTGTCAARGGTARQCIYIDASWLPGGTTDTWKGLMCLDSPASPANAGDPCMTLNQCKDGYQCDGATLTCQQLCTKGGSPTCSVGTCTNAFATPATGPGLCR